MPFAISINLAVTPSGEKPKAVNIALTAVLIAAISWENFNLAKAAASIISSRISQIWILFLFARITVSDNGSPVVGWPTTFPFTVILSLALGSFFASIASFPVCGIVIAPYIPGSTAATTGFCAEYPSKK